MDIKETVIMKKINVLLITTVSMFAFAAQAMEPYGKKRIKEQGIGFLRSLQERKRRNGLSGYGIHRAVVERQANLQQKYGNQVLAHALSKMNKRQPQHEENLKPRNFNRTVPFNQVRNEQVRRRGLTFLQDFMAANIDFRLINIRINHLKVRTPGIIDELRRTGNDDVVPYIEEEEQN